MGKTLRDAVILVAIVILIFLQDWRSVILPLIDITVSLVGTLAIMYAFGFTLNNLTLFGLVLAIGIVVDDAIVVLENIERWLAKGLPVRLVMFEGEGHGFRRAETIIAVAEQALAFLGDVHGFVPADMTTR